MDCWVARAVAELDIMLSSSRMSVIESASMVSPAKVGDAPEWMSCGRLRVILPVPDDAVI